MATRDELGAVTERYARSERAEKSRILDEFVAVSGFLRKHAMRVLRNGPQVGRSGPRPERRLYDYAVGEGLIVLWEASDRICGKRLKALVPILVEAMERHGHLQLAPEVRAAFGDECGNDRPCASRGPRERRWRQAAPARRILALRRSIPIRTFSDWQEPPPGFVETNLVAHTAR